MIENYIFEMLKLILAVFQGEDGFPGFKGDMGLKGDRVSSISSPPGLGSFLVPVSLGGAVILGLWLVSTGGVWNARDTRRGWS